MPDESFPHSSQFAFFGSTTSIFMPSGSLALRTTQFFLCALLAAQLAMAQQDPTISVNVKVVNLPVTVRDKHNQIVRDLTVADFNLLEDGHPQTIRYFSQETNLPLTLGLLVDTSLSQRNVLDEERNASKLFLDQMLVNEKDAAFLIHFDREVELLQDLTPSKEKLQKGLESLQTPASDRSERGGDSSGPPDSRSPDAHGGGIGHGGGTLLYDAVFLASNELMKKQQGRKALVILSDGVDRGSKESLESAVESAQKADTVVYSILFSDRHEENRGFDPNRGGRGGGMGRRGGGWPGGGGSWPGGGGPGGGGGGGRGRSEESRPDGKKVLTRLSVDTGGRMFEVSKKLALDQIYDSIAEELRTQYSLGYTPDKSNFQAGYHKIQLTVKRKDLTVQTRDGYYAEQ